jgi:acylphosphatase
MGLKRALSNWRNNYVIRQVEQLVLPDFAASEPVRRRYCFAGRVQKVGFRLEVVQLAGRLGLSGWCRNLPDGAVEAELQGEAAKIDFLVSFMHSLSRIKISRMAVQELPLISESGFSVH